MLRNAALFITRPKKALTAGPRFCEVQPLPSSLFFPAPLGFSPRNGLAPSPKLFASSFVSPAPSNPVFRDFANVTRTLNPVETNRKLLLNNRTQVVNTLITLSLSQRPGWAQPEES